MDKKEKKSLPEPRTYTVEQIAAMLNIGRTTAYQLVKQEEFRIVRIGNAIRVSKNLLTSGWKVWNCEYCKKRRRLKNLWRFFIPILKEAGNEIDRSRNEDGVSD